MHRIALALALTALAGAQTTDSLLRAELPSLEALYKHLHAAPELSYRETQTGARMAEELRAAGYEVTSPVGGTGVVGVLRNGPGKTVLVRTDLDGLPVTEATGLPYASQVRVKNDQGLDTGVMHACGHDMHMTAFVGAARLLAKTKAQWSGTVVMIGQPAEERGGGALAMLKDGLYTRFPKPDFALALHTDAALEAGSAGYVEGYSMANVDSIDITIRGVGGHGAYPHATKDPVVIAAQTIMALQTIVSREVRPLDSAVVTVGSIHGGTKHNIIGDEVKLQLTVRSYKESVREQILQSIRRIVTNTARAAGVPPDREPVITLVNDDFTPANYNDPALVKRIVPALEKALGKDKVVARDPEMGGEDFSQLHNRQSPPIPGFLMRFGTVDPARVKAAREGGPPLPSLHSPQYAPVIHPTIETATKTMVAAVHHLLGK